MLLLLGGVSLGRSAKPVGFAPFVRSRKRSMWVVTNYVSLSKGASELSIHVINNYDAAIMLANHQYGSCLV